MNKRKIIITSIVLSVVLLMIISFCTIFRVRKRLVTQIGEESVAILSEEVLSASGLKKGQFTLSLNKDKLAQNIENKLPEVKVVQIRTISPISVEIVVKNRIKTYYTSVEIQGETKFFVMDEELKILEISDTLSQPYIEISNLSLNINENTKLYSFAGNKSIQLIASSFYVSAYKTMTDAPTKQESRQQILSMVEKIELLDDGITLSERYNRLIITTKSSSGYGASFDIAKPEIDLTRKLNMCVSALNSGDFDKTSGTFQIKLKADGTEYFGHIDAE